jgi:hypothetical protein
MVLDGDSPRDEGVVGAKDLLVVLNASKFSILIEKQAE